jgi:hypothetical protein
MILFGSCLQRLVGFAFSEHIAIAHVEQLKPWQ